jgi:hypothetical protein
VKVNLGRVVAIVALGFIGAVVGENVIIETYVKPVAIERFLAQDQLPVDIASLNRDRHFPVAHIGSGLFDFCPGYGNCFAWDDYASVDVIIGISPEPRFAGPVRVLRNCDGTECVWLPRFDAYIRLATSQEVALDRDDSSQTACDEEKLLIYAVRYCRTEYTMAGHVQSIYHGLSVHSPFILRYSVEFAGVGYVRIDLVTRKAFASNVFGQLRFPRSP